MIKSRLLVSSILLISLLSCDTKQKKDQASIVLKNTSHRYQAALANTKIKDIPIQTKLDTISYALGVAWSNGLAKVGKHTISPAFYFGASDYIYDYKSILDIYKAEKYLETEFEKVKSDSTWPAVTMEIKLSEIEVKTKYDTVSYALGMAWCRAAKQYGIPDVSPALLVGLTAGLKGDSTFFDYSQADRYLRAYVETVREEKFAETKNINEKWIAENKNRPDVITLPSGLQYKIIKKGSGKPVTMNNVLECRYTSKLIDGTLFENSDQEYNGEPFKFFPSSVVQGWQEAVMLMKEGDHWELYLPYYLAYGSGGVKNKVPGFATVIIDVELLHVRPPLQN